MFQNSSKNTISGDYVKVVNSRHMYMYFTNTKEYMLLSAQFLYISVPVSNKNNRNDLKAR
jgi:hypothetical protein